MTNLKVPNPANRFAVVQHRIDSLMQIFKREIEANPLHFGMRFDSHANAVDDGAQYLPPVPERPAFAKEDLDGWEPIGPSFND